MYSGPIGAPGKTGAVKDPVMTPGQIKKNRREGKQLLLFSAEQNSEQGMKFVYILVGFTGECLNRQTAAGLPSQQLINNSVSLPLSFCVYVSVRARLGN